jgi:hypothetical protein
MDDPNFQQGLAYRYSSLCDSMRFGCYNDVPFPIFNNIIGLDSMTPAPSNYSLNNYTLILNTNPGAMCATLSGAVTVDVAPPTVLLTSYKVDPSGFTALYGVNSGNAGNAILNVNYTAGPADSIPVMVNSGSFALRVSSSNVVSACIGASCLQIVPGGLLGGAGAAMAASNGATVATGFFSTSSAVFLGIQITILVIASSTVLFLGFIVVRKLRQRWRLRKNNYSVVNGSDFERGDAPGGKKKATGSNKRKN